MRQVPNPRLARRRRTLCRQSPRGCTFIPMESRVSFSPLLRAGLCMVALAASTAWHWPVAGHTAKQPRSNETATLIEAGSYVPCGERCSLVQSPASAFCFRLGAEVLVADGSSYLHEGKFAGVEDLTGKPMPVRLSGRSIWVTQPDGTTVKLKYGSQFEGFHDSSCVAAVNEPILARANRHGPPGRVPSDALAIAGSGKGALPPVYLWFDCVMEAGGGTIGCDRWNHKGRSAGKDWYCARTLDGGHVEGALALDPLLSRDGRLVLKSGGVLLHDGRGRVDGQLERPGEACY